MSKRENSKNKLFFETLSGAGPEARGQQAFACADGAPRGMRPVLKTRGRPAIVPDESN